MSMMFHKAIIFYLITNLYKSLKESTVVTGIKAFWKIFQERYLSIHREHIGWMDNIFLNFLSWESQQSKDNRIKDKFFKSHELNACKSSNGRDKKVWCFFKIPDQNTINSFEDFKFIFLFPISSLLDQFQTLVDVFFDWANVFFFYIHEQDFEENLHLFWGWPCQGVSLTEHLFCLDKV